MSVRGNRVGPTAAVEFARAVADLVIIQVFVLSLQIDLTIAFCEQTFTTKIVNYKTNYGNKKSTKPTITNINFKRNILFRFLLRTMGLDLERTTKPLVQLPLCSLQETIGFVLTWLKTTLEMLGKSILFLFFLSFFRFLLSFIFFFFFSTRFVSLFFAFSCATLFKHGLELGGGAPRLDSLDLSSCGLRHKALVRLFELVSSSIFSSAL